MQRTRYYDVPNYWLGVAFGALLALGGATLIAWGVSRRMAGGPPARPDPAGTPNWLIWAGAIMTWAAPWVMVICLRLARQAARLEEILDGGGEIWDYREDWQAFRVAASNKRETAVAWCWAGVAALGVPWPFLLADERWWYGVVWLALGAAAGLGALGRAVMRTTLYSIYGNPVLHLREVPLTMGHAVAALLSAARPLPERLEVALKCTETHAEQDGCTPSESGTHSVANTVVNRRVLPMSKPLDDGAGGVIIPLMIEVPEVAPDATPLGTDRVRWTLEAVSGYLPWSFSASFDLPVFRAGDDEVRAMSQRTWQALVRGLVP